MADYQRFIGIDWSGAGTLWQRGIAVAMAERGQAPVTLVANPYAVGKPWRRADVVRWLHEQMAQPMRLLIGIDASFGFPYADAGGYFPEHDTTISTPAALWAHIEAICVTEQNFYAGRATTAAHSLIRPYLLTNKGGRGSHFRMRWRVTEQWARQAGATPSSVCKGIGADAVAMGSLAAMRVAAHLARDTRLGIWPFIPHGQRQHTMTEIFPRLYYQRAGGKGGDWRSPEAFARVLAAYGATAAPVATEDAGDAIVAAAALRVLADDASTWQAINIQAAEHEGWIFGVTASIAFS